MILRLSLSNALALVLLSLSSSSLFVNAKGKSGVNSAGNIQNSVANKAVKAQSMRGTTEKTVPLRTHSLYAREFFQHSCVLCYNLTLTLFRILRICTAYVDSDLQNRWFDFGGSAIINTNKHVRLTQDRSSQAGWLWSRLGLAPASFEIEFEFRVDGKSNSLFGDGFAVWLTKGRAGMGPVFGSTDYWDGLGIFFDT